MDRRQFLRQSAVSAVGISVLPFEEVISSSYGGNNNGSRIFPTFEINLGNLIVRLLKRFGGELFEIAKKIFTWVKEKAGPIILEVAQWINQVGEAVERIFHLGEQVKPYFNSFFENVTDNNSKVQITLINDSSKFFTFDVWGGNSGKWSPITIDYKPEKNFYSLGKKQDLYKIGIHNRNFLGGGCYLFKQSGEYKVSELFELSISVIDDNFYKVYAPGTGLKLRKGKTINSDLITTMDHGALVKVIEKDDKVGSWWKVKHGDKVGYCFSSYLNKVEKSK